MVPASSSGIIPAWRGGRGVSAEVQLSIAEVQLSKALSDVLRHNARKRGVEIRPDGFCLVSDILRLSQFQRLRCTIADVEIVVRLNNKQRFELWEEAPGIVWIRALQGHSMDCIDDEELGLEKLDPASGVVTCYHGTPWRNLRSIRRSGLIAGGIAGGKRNHVHFSQKVEPWQRECILECDLRRAIEAGLEFFRSRNGVILTRGPVPAEYLRDTA